MNIKKVPLSAIDDDNSDVLNHLVKRWKDEEYDKRLEEIIARSTKMREKIYGSEEE